MRAPAVASLAVLLVLLTVQADVASATPATALAARDTGERGLVSTLRCLAKLFTVTWQDVRNMAELLFRLCPSGELGPLPVCLLKVAVVVTLGYVNGIVMCLRGWQP